MSNVWEYLGNIQDKLTQKPGKAPAPFNADGKVPFGTALDIAKSLPNNPTSYNDKIEQARVALQTGAASVIGKPAGIAAGAAIGSVVPGVGTAIGAGIGTAAFTIAELDKASDGKVSKALMAGTKNVRSNYAFVSDVAKHDAGMGFLATLTMIAGGTLGAVGGFAVAGPAGAVAGAALGAAIAGKAERGVAESGMIGKQLEASAKLSQSDVGQERYNFGRDAVHVASKVTGWQTLGDTSKGIGAVTSGLINIGFEASTAPDIKGTQLAGKVARTALVGGITEPIAGIATKKLAETEFGRARMANRLAKDIDLLKKTAAGEKTPYTPVFQFYRENDAATILQRPEFRGNEYGQIGANLVAGKSDEVISLVLRAGRGDKAAIDELSAKHASTFNEMLRAEGVALDTQNKIASFITPTKNVAFQKQLADDAVLLEAEIKDLRAQYSWLDKSLLLDSALQERTVSSFAGVEKLRNDLAKQRAVNKLEQAAIDITSRETAIGNIVQKVYQKNGLSAVIRTIERRTDDAPHQTVNFNDAIQSTTRVRTTMRMAINKKVLPGVEAKKIYDDFVTSKTELEKLAVIDNATERIFEQVANKYNVPSGIKDLVLKEYVTLTKKNRAKAKEAHSQNRAYMIDGDEVIKDPQLISQLANGAYLPDVELIDKAFARYANKKGAELSLPVNAAIMGKTVLDEFNSLWRNFTLARAGFPINVVRDSTLRTWADGSLFYSLAALGEQTLQNITKSTATVSQMKRYAAGVVNPKKNMKNIREDIAINENALLAAKQALKDAKYDPAKPPKEISPELQRTINYVKTVESTVAELRRQEQALVNNIPSKVVGRDTTSVYGYNFPAAFSGRYGDLSFQKLRGKDDIRGLLASTRELAVANVRRDRTGGAAIKAIDNEDLHLRSWDNTLNNILRNDPVSREILKRNAKDMDPRKVQEEVVNWIRSDASGNIVERFGYDPALKRELRYSDANYIYQRVLSAINQFAPDIKLQKLVIEDKATPLELKKMYPDITSRPDVIGDMALDLTGNSTLVKNFNKYTKDVVTWLATVPTSRLSYNPYFQAKYEHKLQSMVALANAQGRKLSEMKQDRFEATARSYALNEYRAKINSFNRDMNYPQLVNYVMAFFPAVVEQYRSYGKLTMEHPEFPFKVLTMSNIPSQLGQVRTDEFGTDYIEVTLPLLGIKGRLPTSWFNAINPTGGHILSAGPLATATVNEVAKRVDLPTKFTEMVLPFGTQANGLGALTPNTLRRAGQAFQGFFLKNGEQYNKDMNMFIEMKRKEFEDTNHRQPTGNELPNMYREASKDSTSLAVLRALGAGILPSQPRYVSPLQVYSDLLSKYNKEYGNDGVERFTNDYPEYYMLADKLTDSTSGLRSDDTAFTLVRDNKDVVENIVANIKTENLSVLGAVFNDDDYAFSSTAQAYLTTHAIPGTRKKFKEQGAALENNRSSIVNKGWKDWNSMIEIVTQEVINNNYDPATGYGKTIIDTYKKNFTEQMKTDNNLWYEEKLAISASNRSNDTIKALTIAANTPKLWSQLAKQPRWHTLVDYLNFRYDVYDALKQRGATINSDKASDIRDKANQYVAKLRREDINFGKYYDRYFDGDEFNYVYEAPSGGK